MNSAFIIEYGSITNDTTSTIKINSRNCVVGTFDFMFLSHIPSSSTPVLIIFDGKQPILLDWPPVARDYYGFYAIAIDHNDNIWCAGERCGVWIHFLI